MLDTLHGNAAPLLMSLTGDNYETFGRGKINWKKVKKGLKKVGKVAAWVAAPQVMASIAAVKATRGALKRKREKNIGNLQIERAERDRKIAEARKAQAIAKQEEVVESQKARVAEQAEQAEQAENAPEETTEESPTEETTEEEIVESTEEGAEQAAEMSGYSRSNDDYFVGAAALKKPLKKKVSAVKLKSLQLKTIAPAKKPNTALYVAGGLGLAALLFNKQLKKALR